MSFEKFAVVSVENNLFTDHAQNKFLNISKKEQIAVKFQELKNSWNEKKEQYLYKFKQLSLI